jgi:hypothetical protein
MTTILKFSHYSILFSNLVIIHLLAYEDGTDSVPKRQL